MSTSQSKKQANYGVVAACLGLFLVEVAEFAHFMVAAAAYMGALVFAVKALLPREKHTLQVLTGVLGGLALPAYVLTTTNQSPTMFNSVLVLAFLAALTLKNTAFKEF